MTAVVDITREVCPMTYVRVKLKLETLEVGSDLAVLLRGDEPLRNIPRSVRADGHEVISIEPNADDVFRLVIRKGNKEGRRG